MYNMYTETVAKPSLFFISNNDGNDNPFKLKISLQSAHNQLMFKWKFCGIYMLYPFL